MECGKNAAPDIFEDIVNTVDRTTVVWFFFIYFEVSSSYSIKRMKFRCPEPRQNVSLNIVA